MSTVLLKFTCDYRFSLSFSLSHAPPLAHACMQPFETNCFTTYSEVLEILSPLVLVSSLKLHNLLEIQAHWTLLLR